MLYFRYKIYLFDGQDITTSLLDIPKSSSECSRQNKNAMNSSETKTHRVQDVLIIVLY